MTNRIDIGKIIKETLKQQNKSVSWLSRELGTNRMACYRMFSKQSIDTEVLRRVSIILKHDFFKIYSNSLVENSQSLSD